MYDKLRERASSAGSWIIYRPAVMIPLLLAVVATIGIVERHVDDSRTVSRYCAYGSVSEDQRDSCPDRVSVSYINSLDTNAALYARDELEECLEDSGPFCSPVNPHAVKTRERRLLLREADAQLDDLKLDADAVPDYDWSTAEPAGP